MTTCEPILLESNDGLHPDYPLPDLEDPIMRPFWDGARQGKLMLQRERHTGRLHWPPKPLYWREAELEWFEASGFGTVFSYVIAYEPFLPAFRHRLPMVLAIVETDEGARLVTYIVNCPPEQVHFGMPVRVVFERLNDAVVLPVWAPAGREGQGPTHD
ncbi:MAG: OB-fold domain-containing protein [Candidatus Binatia bacterium]|nr:OB-fold domain-containing protein [Candidatus Binatia bacterium]